MPQLSEIKIDGKFRGLFVGDSGSGKSCAAASFPKPMFWMDCTGRTQSILGYPKSKDWLSEIEVEYMMPYNKFVDKLNDRLDVLLIQYAKPPLQHPYKTINFEDISTASDFFLEYACDITGSTKSTKKIGGQKVASWDEYRLEQDGFRDLTVNLFSLPAHIIVHGHLVDAYDDENKVKGKKVNMRDKVMAGVAKYFNEIYHFTKEVETVARGGEAVQIVKHYVQFRGAVARTIFHWFPDGRVDITNKDFYSEVWLPLVQKGLADVVTQ